MTFPWRH